MKALSVLNRREKYILYLTVGLFFFALVFNFIISPVMTSTDRLNKETEHTRVKLKKYLTLLSQKDSIMSRYGKYASSYKASEGGKEAVVNVLSELEGLSKGAGIKITDIRPETSAVESAYKELMIDLRAEGAIDAYLKFMYDLENSLSLFKIKKFRLSSKQNSPDLEGSFSVSKVLLD